jgi:RNase P subunit RPR2
MSYEYCPRCQKLEYTSVSMTLRFDQDIDSKSKEIMVRNHHCVSCGTFVRGEDIKTIPEGLDISAEV